MRTFAVVGALLTGLMLAAPAHAQGTPDICRVTPRYFGCLPPASAVSRDNVLPLSALGLDRSVSVGQLLGQMTTADVTRALGYLPIAPDATGKLPTSGVAGLDAALAGKADAVALTAEIARALAAEAVNTGGAASISAALALKADATALAGKADTAALAAEAARATAAEGTKPNAANGTLTGAQLVSPTVSTGSNLPAFGLAEHLAGAGFPTIYNADPRTAVFNAPVTIRSATSGESHRAGGLEVSLNDNNDQGCSNGGFYDNPLTRGIYGGRDIVGGCFNVRAPAPIALRAAVVFQTNAANTRNQTTAASGSGYAPVNTGRTVQGTRAVFATPLTAAQVAGLTVGMVVETNNNSTGIITAWDSAGGSIDVDQWVLIASDPVLSGYSPADYGGNVVTINTVSQAYGINVNVTVPPDAYRQNNSSTNALAAEFSIYNTQSTVVRNEFDGFNDIPRIWGLNIGVNGTVARPGGSGAVVIGHWDKGYAVYSMTDYAGFLYGAGAGTPGEGAFVSQQNAGNAFVIKPSIRGGSRTFSVASQNGAITSGLAPVRQAAVGVVWSATSVNATDLIAITPTGNPLPANGNTLAVMALNSVYTVTGVVSCSDGAGVLTWNLAASWFTGADNSATLIKGFTLNPLSTAGTVTGWGLTGATDAAGLSPQVLFSGAAGVSCTGNLSTMQVRG